MYFLPVPGSIRLSTKQAQAKARGICGTARRNMPCLIVDAFTTPILIDGRLLDDIDTWLRRGLRVPGLLGSGVNERCSSYKCIGNDIFLLGS